jgi:hypothetical protein
MSRRIHAQRPPSGAVPIAEEHRLNRFLHTLRTQRWDDHRYYHQSRINQALHLASALGFLVAYAVVFIDPALAALIAWGFSMTTRQAGHFFFEPKGYDHVNEASFKHKEAIKVGYNLERKVVLLATSAWAGSHSVWPACCSAPRSCSSCRARSRRWPGPPRSSLTRSTT